MFSSPHFIYEHAKAHQRELLEEAANRRAARLARVTRRRGTQPRTRSFAWLLAAVGRGMSDLGGRLQRVQYDQRLQHELRLQRDQRTQALSARVASRICEICGARLDSVPEQTGGMPGGPMLTADQ